VGTIPARGLKGNISVCAQANDAGGETQSNIEESTIVSANLNRRKEHNSDHANGANSASESIYPAQRRR
jgi:hypothetical protein